MVNWPSLIPVLKLVAIVVVLALVLYIDFMFRRDLYNRSDPLSFSILGYSVLLVVPLAFLSIIGGIKTESGVAVEVSRSVVIGAVVYLPLLFVLFLGARAAHKSILSEQEKLIKSYLKDLRSLYPMAIQDGVWTALEELGKSMIEPDVFRKISSKQEKRVEYLTLVKDSTNIDSISPTNDEEKLLVSKKKRAQAQRWYFVVFVFGLASSLYFYTWGSH